ncbi:unnamed protein product [Amoebophrya sp. A120]|nr:unnamed protein product [Amoebophrya sp. A120]|eukprot:GSA120T00017320001.1
MLATRLLAFLMTLKRVRGESAVVNKGRAPGTTVIVAGATGRTGQLIYEKLRTTSEPHLQVRALVRSRTKAREVLHCDKCDASENIFVADITDADGLEACGVFDSASVSGSMMLVIATSAIPKCKEPFTGNPSDCVYPPGGSPREVDWNGGRNLIKAFARRSSESSIKQRSAANEDRAVAVSGVAAESAAATERSVVLISAMGTTEPASFLDKLGEGWISFYKLNLEAFLSSAGVRNVIVKPCGLKDDIADNKNLKFITGHDDEHPVSVSPIAATKKTGVPTSKETRVMTRNQLADLSIAAVQWLKQHDDPAGYGTSRRFDVCTQDGAQQASLVDVVNAAGWPWQNDTPEDRLRTSSQRNAELFN